MRRQIIFDLSSFKTEYNSDPSSRIASKPSWLSSVIPSAGSSSIDIIYGSDNCNGDSLGYDSVENVDFIDDFVKNEDSAENEGFDENDCN